MRITKKPLNLNKNHSPYKDNTYINNNIQEESNLNLLSNKSSHKEIPITPLITNKISSSKINNELISPDKDRNTSEQTTPKFSKPQIKSYQKVNIGSLKAPAKKINESSTNKTISQSRVLNLKEIHANKESFKQTQRAYTPVPHTEKISYALRKNYIVPNPKGNLNRSKSANRDIDDDERNNRSFTESSVNKASRLDTSYDKMNKTTQVLNQKTKNSLSFSVDKGFNLSHNNKNKVEEDRTTVNQKKNILSMKLEKLKKIQQEKKLHGNVIFNGNNPYSVKNSSQTGINKVNIPNIIKTDTLSSNSNNNTNYNTTSNANHTYMNFLSNSSVKPESSNYIRHIQTNVKYQTKGVNNDESNSNDEDTPNFENTIIQTNITPIVQDKDENTERFHKPKDPYVSTKAKIKNGKFTDSESSNKFAVNKNYKRDRIKVFSFGLGLDNFDQD